MNIKPIKTDEDLAAALAEIDRLWGAPLDTPRGDKLDVLITLVEAYEAIHYPIDPPDPVEAIAFRLDQLGLSRNALLPALGSRSRISEVLNRKRALSLPMIRRLHQQFGIPLESLIHTTATEAPHGAQAQR